MYFEKTVFEAPYSVLNMAANPFLPVQPVHFATKPRYSALLNNPKPPSSRWDILVWKTSTEYFRVCQRINEAGPGSSPEDTAGRAEANIITHVIRHPQYKNTRQLNSSSLPALTLQVREPGCDLHHGKIKYQLPVSINPIILWPLSAVHWHVNSLISPHLAHEPQECFFILDLQQFEIVFSLQSHPRSANYLRTAGLFKMSLLLFTLVYIHLLVRRKKTVLNAWLSLNLHLMPLSLFASWSNILISMAGQMYSN